MRDIGMHVWEEHSDKLEQTVGMIGHQPSRGDHNKRHEIFEKFKEEYGKRKRATERSKMGFISRWNNSSANNTFNSSATSENSTDVSDSTFNISGKHFDPNGDPTNNSDPYSLP